MTGFVFKKDSAAAAANGVRGLASGLNEGLTIEGIFLKQDKSKNYKVDICVTNKQTGAGITFYDLCIGEKWMKAGDAEGNPTGSVNSGYKVWQELAEISGINVGTLAPYDRKTASGVEKQNGFTECLNKVISINFYRKLDLNQDGVPRKPEAVLKQSFSAAGFTVAELDAKLTTPVTIEAVRSATVSDYKTEAYKNYEAGSKNNASTPDGDADASSNTSSSDEDLV